MAYLSYKYRIYPNREQKEIFSRTFGCVRLVYNLCLEYERYLQNIGDPPASQKDMLSYLSVVLLNEYPFLKDVDFYVLCQAVFNLFRAYQRYWDHKSNPPAFKSRKISRNSFSASASRNLLIVGPDFVSLSGAGGIKATIHRPLPESASINNFTITQEPDDSFYCSVLFSYSPKGPHHPVDIKKSIGLDYCAKGLFTDSNGYECNAPRYAKELQKRLKHEKKKLSKKVGGKQGVRPSKNYLKQQKKVNRVYRKIVNRRNDYLQKKSTELISKYDVICVEHLDMNEMSARGRGFSKSTMDNAYGRFLELLNYKAHDKGKYLIRVDRWFPSSQICSICGFRQKIEIGQRVFHCPRCGANIPRDYNAAVNIKREGIRILTHGASR